LPLRSNISTKCVLRNASACTTRIEFDMSDIRCIFSISLNANGFNSVKYRFDSIRRSCKRRRCRNACGSIVISPVLIIERY
jgi:hypothetical protein